MSQGYVELLLQEKTNAKNKEYTFEEILKEDSNIFIILGASGSGKSTLVKSYADKYKTITFCSATQFLERTQTKIEKNIETIMIDGLDEYPNSSRESLWIRLAERLKLILEKKSNRKIFITARTAYWRENDHLYLKKELENVGLEYAVRVFEIKPLNDTQKRKMGEFLSIQNIDAFLKKYNTSIFLNNPQMFKMLAKLPNMNKGVSKADLYHQFILNSREHNQTHLDLDQDLNNFSNEEMLEAIGYLACFYLLCKEPDNATHNNESFDIEKNGFGDSILNQINDKNKNLLLSILKTKVFDESKSFIHRSIAEYAMAYYLVHHKLNGDYLVQENRVRSLFIESHEGFDFIRPHLRGTYAWLCSLSENEFFIENDPYYQAYYGDNSNFSQEKKKFVLDAIERYSHRVPYFLDFTFGRDFIFDYNHDGDLVERHKRALPLRNHNIYLLNSILVKRAPESKTIREYIKSLLLDPEVQETYKNELIIEELRDDFLALLLEAIKNNSVPDTEDILKDQILNILYPKHIRPIEIIRYLKLYQNTSYITSRCDFLYATPDAEKHELVVELHESFLSKKTHTYPLILMDIQQFVNHYFNDVFLKIDENNIADIQEKFQYFYSFWEQYYHEWERMNFLDSEQIHTKRTQRISKEMFQIHLRKAMDSKDFFCLFRFPFYPKPKKIATILLNNINNSMSQDLKNQMISYAFSWLSDEEEKDKFFIQKIEELNLKKEFLQFQSEKKQQKLDCDRQVENTQKQTLSKIKQPSIFDDLDYLYNNDDKNLTIEHLARIDISRRSGAEYATYEILRNNATNYEISKITNDDFKKYLYINALWYEYRGDRDVNFCSKFEETYPSMVNDILIEYIRALLKNHTKQISQVIEKYMKLANMEELKYLCNINSVNNLYSNFIQCFLKIYGLTRMSLEDSKQLYAEIKKDKASQQENISTLESLMLLKKDSKKRAYKLKHALNFYELLGNFDNKKANFFNLPRTIKLGIATCMLHSFNTPESLTTKQGVLTTQDECVIFARYEMLNLLDMDELKELLEKFEDNIMWKNMICHMIFEKNKTFFDSNHMKESYTFKEIKDFLLKNTILSANDFFEEICNQFERLKKTIEQNIDNDKQVYLDYEKRRNEKNKENKMRDLVVQRLKAQYNSTCIREYQCGNNRADINILFNKNTDYQIRIECKRDSNKELESGIQDQLVSKYLSHDFAYGIYLVFYFGKCKKTLKDLESSLNAKIQDSMQNKIRVFIIDFL